MNGEVKTNGAATPAVQPGTELWRHSNPNSTQLHDFMTRVNKKYGKNFQTYQQLYRWSIDDISDFWSEIWQYVGVRASKPYEKVGDFPVPIPL